MDAIDLRREENYKKYLLLIDNPDYLHVTFDEMSGGISAIHKEHCFDKQVGPFGCHRGQYEIDASSVLRRKGFSVLLESEFPRGKKVKAYDAMIDGVRAEIKTIERNGRWSIRTKIHMASKQGAELGLLDILGDEIAVIG